MLNPRVTPSLGVGFRMYVGIYSLFDENFWTVVIYINNVMLPTYKLYLYLLPTNSSSRTETSRWFDIRPFLDEIAHFAGSSNQFGVIQAYIKEIDETVCAITCRTGRQPRGSISEKSQCVVVKSRMVTIIVYGHHMRWYHRVHLSDSRIRSLTVDR